MTLPLFPETYSVSALAGEVRALLREAYDGVWVTGEIHALKIHRSGHVYLDLVEKDAAGDTILAKLDAVLWARDHERVRRLLTQHGQRLAEGLTIRCRCNVDFYPPHGKLQVQIRDIDPVFTLGALEMRRRETMAALVAAGLLDRNRALPLVDLPLRVALITSEGSAAYHDFLSTLSESGYGFQLLFFHAAVQGPQAEREVAAALAAVGRFAVDCVVMVRGGGARSDLAAFDSRAIAEAVAMTGVPVITGLGHEIDESIADRVAHTMQRTPTKAAEFLIGLVAEAEDRYQRVRSSLMREAEEPLLTARRRMERATQGLRLAVTRLARQGDRVRELGRGLAALSRRRLGEAARRREETRIRLGLAAPRMIQRQDEAAERPLRRLADLAGARLGKAAIVLAGLERLASSLDPQRTLHRGYSITRTSTGRLLRQPGEVRAGELLRTQIERGVVTSRVEEGETER
ncbi:MAG: exodeoxyribonuclease VII large subunit [Acidobacteriota bacterium]